MLETSPSQIPIVLLQIQFERLMLQVVDVLRKDLEARRKLAKSPITRAIPQVLEYTQDGHRERKDDNKPQNSGKICSENSEYYYKRRMNLHLRALNFEPDQIAHQKMNAKITETNPNDLSRICRQRNQDSKTRSQQWTNRRHEVHHSRKDGQWKSKINS